MVRTRVPGVFILLELLTDGVDGPALRSTAIITYANWLLANGNGTSYVTGTLWPMIKLDLDYVMDNWNETT